MGGDTPKRVSEKKVKTKRKKKALSYCQRLIHDIESSEAARASSKFPRYSQLLALPPELRQVVLYNTLDDDEMLTLPLESSAVELSKSCKTINADMDSVVKLWTTRLKQLQEHQAVQRAGFDSYIKDLMAHSNIAQTRLLPPRKAPKLRNRMKAHCGGISPIESQPEKKCADSTSAVAIPAAEPEIGLTDVERWHELKREAKLRDKERRKNPVMAAALNEAFRSQAQNRQNDRRRKRSRRMRHSS